MYPITHLFINAITNKTFLKPTQQPFGRMPIGNGRKPSVSLNIIKDLSNLEHMKA